MHFTEGFAIFKTDKVLRGALIFMIFGWIIIDLMLSFTNLGINNIIISITAVIFNVLFVLLVLSCVAKIEEWSTKKIILVLMISLPLYPLTLYLLLGGFGIVLIVMELLMSAIFAHWLCLNVGSTVQRKVEDKKGLGVVLYLFFSVLALILYYFLIRFISPPQGFQNIWNSVGIVLLIFAWFVILGFILGLVRKQYPIALGPYYMMTFFYYLYLFARLLMTLSGFSQERLLLISVPVNIFLLLYAMGMYAYKFYVQKGLKEATRQVRATMIFFMLAEISVHIAVVYQLYAQTQTISTEDFFAFIRLVLFILLILVVGIYIVIKYSKKKD